MLENDELYHSSSPRREHLCLHVQKRVGYLDNTQLSIRSVFLLHRAVSRTPDTEQLAALDILQTFAYARKQVDCCICIEIQLVRLKDKRFVCLCRTQQAQSVQRVGEGSLIRFKIYFGVGGWSRRARRLQKKIQSLHAEGARITYSLYMYDTTNRHRRQRYRCWRCRYRRCCGCRLHKEHLCALRQQLVEGVD